jgi:biotin transport system substrate-specific component
MTDTTRTVGQYWTANVTLRRGVAVVAGALLVALGAQISVPLPGTPVPLTFQVPAALIVGGLLGRRLGAASLVLYLVLGAAGLPVFAPIGLPGFARLIGPTGGYLLALPLAAAVMGLACRGERSIVKLAVGLVSGLAVIYAGGIAQLAILDGDLAIAWRIGSLPFLAGDAVKLLLAGLIVGRLRAPMQRALH